MNQNWSRTTGLFDYLRRHILQNNVSFWILSCRSIVIIRRTTKLIRPSEPSVSSLQWGGRISVVRFRARRRRKAYTRRRAFARNFTAILRWHPSRFLGIFSTRRLKQFNFALDRGGCSEHSRARSEKIPIQPTDNWQTSGPGARRQRFRRVSSGTTTCSRDTSSPQSQ